MSERINHSSGNIDFMDRFLTLSRGSKRLESLGQSVSFPKGTLLGRPGEIPSRCFIVKSGRVICYELSRNGERRIYNFLEPGSLFLEELLLFDKPCPVFFETALPTELIEIGKEDLTHAFRHDIDVVLDVCESMSAKYLSAMEYQRVGNKQDASWQICRFILLLIEHYGKHENGRIRITEKFSHQIMADLLGMNRVTVSRKLKNLRDQNLICLDNGYMIVPDVDALKNHMTGIAFDK